MSEWPKLDAYLDHIGQPHGAPTLCGTDGSRLACPMHAPLSHHYDGWSRDYGNATNDCPAIVKALLPLWNAGSLLELYYAPTGTWFPTNVGGHTDHIHVTIKPGIILPGADMPLSADDLSKITTIVQQQVFKLMADFFNNQYAPLLSALKVELDTIKFKVGA